LLPLAEQHEIVRRVGLLFERADAFDQEVVAAGRRCERLTQEGEGFCGEFSTGLCPKNFNQTLILFFQPDFD